MTEQDALVTEKPAIPATNQPANKSSTDSGDESRSEGQPRGKDEGSAQPMAHPPEDTFVAAGTTQPGKSAR